MTSSHTSSSEDIGNVGWLAGAVIGFIVVFLIDPSFNREPWYLAWLLGALAAIWVSGIVGALLRKHVGWAGIIFLFPIAAVGYFIWYYGQAQPQRASTNRAEPTASTVGVAPPTAPQQATAVPSDELRELGRLHSEGVIDDAEYAAAKKRILGI